MRQSEPALEKYLVTQSENFILATIVALSMGITDGKILFCHGISEGSVGRIFQRDSTTTGHFMTASITPFRMLVVSHILIYLP